VTAVTAIAADGSAQELDFVAGALEQCHGFLLHQVELVSALVTAAERLSADGQQRVIAELRMSAYPRAYFMPELVKRRDQAYMLSGREDLGTPVRKLYAAVAEQFQNTIDDDLRRDAEEDEA